MAQSAAVRQLLPLLLTRSQALATSSSAASLPSGLRALASLAQPEREGRQSTGPWATLGSVSLWTSAAAAAAAAASAAGVTLAHADTPAAPKAKTPTPSPDSDYVRPSDLKGVPQLITLYQYEVCPFCCKVKAALDFYKVPYKVVEVNPLTKGELKWSSYKKVPVVKLDEEVLIGSSVIMSRIAAEVEAASSSSSSKSRAKPSAGVSAAVSEEETRWRRWVDDWFVKLLTANIYRSWDESWDTFRYITEQTNWSWGTREVARMSGAVLMWQIGKRLPAKYGVEGDLREALYKACNEFVDAVGPNRPFLGGPTPNLGDLSVYGVLRAVDQTPTFKDAMEHSRIGGWYRRMEAAVGGSSRVSTEGSEWGLQQKPK